MRYNLDRLFRSLWARAVVRTSPAHPALRPGLEVLEERNPPSSLWDFFLPSLASSLAAAHAGPVGTAGTGHDRPTQGPPAGHGKDAGPGTTSAPQADAGLSASGR